MTSRNQKRRKTPAGNKTRREIRKRIVHGYSRNSCTATLARRRVKSHVVGWATPTVRGAVGFEMNCPPFRVTTVTVICFLPSRPTEWKGPLGDNLGVGGKRIQTRANLIVFNGNETESVGPPVARQISVGSWTHVVRSGKSQAE